MSFSPALLQRLCHPIEIIGVPPPKMINFQICVFLQSIKCGRMLVAWIEEDLFI